ncbi:MAG TPA: 4-hydroxy-tetrahydrodipicolinate synthase [Bacillota bacterium]|nr:4-hydroxy-tetrahydrodipicolinate synthase [Peptococcaceae bacterium MAG4]NLW38088.1 4-hydroxy-tetrahydrodipicolinate synthase [Peptococcaceae bacterium]HPZ44400.1 4-hydroxy-tetrahydrodipicolinate synthase [Bacillota bacterium]HQD77072.1 4-hydroxy-tetrahydrodipicolinate synthase [Bacillota bacterium]HUM59735.1 4-hydroxy-tetrahydrodipicolinate synthase [Bacillota bacterium]
MNIDFGNVLTAMVTPFNEDLTVNYSEVRKLARHLVDSGSDGLVITGTTGESPTLSREEKIEIFRAVVEEVGGKAVVIAGTGCNSTSDTIELTLAAQEVGVDGVMLVAPYYNKPSQEGIFQHFKTVAENTRLPILLYNIPGRTSVNILPDTMARLARIENIVAVKEASGNMDQVSELRRILPDRFDIYSGDDSLTLPILALGGKGVISVASHLVGNSLKEMVNAFSSGNNTLATEIHLKLLPLFKALFITTNPVPVKAALNMSGWQVGRPRPPLVEATAEEKEKIYKVLGNLKLA